MVQKELRLLVFTPFGNIFAVLQFRPQALKWLEEIGFFDEGFSPPPTSWLLDVLTEDIQQVVRKLYGERAGSVEVYLDSVCLGRVHL